MRSLALISSIILVTSAGCADDAAPGAANTDTSVEPADAGADATDAASPDAVAPDASADAAPDGGGGVPDASDGRPVVDPDNLPVGVFVPPYVDCREPVPGEAAGASDGLVCTPVAIQGCTEDGRRYDDYAACEVVITQRPYGPSPPAQTAPENDPRLDDEAYMTEMAWLTQQVESCACTCCHSSASAPNGPSGWYIEAGPLWLDTVPDDGLAMLAGLSPSEAFGAWDPEGNNGFDRAHTGLPTNDVDRMQRFLTAELARRGVTEDEARAVPPFGGPLAAQAVFEPGRCPTGQGVLADGTVVWGAASVRYLHILDAGSANPGVTPNRDVPEGTVWKLDAPYNGGPIAPGVVYGETPEGAFQAWPARGAAPPELEPGSDYLLYAQLDMGLPITRCVFTWSP